MPDPTPPVTDPPAHPPVTDPPADPPKDPPKEPPAEPKDGKTDDGKTEGAPEAYEDFTVPEGVNASPEALTKFSELARKHNLPQEAAQEMVDFQAQLALNDAEAAVAAWEKTQDAWLAEAESDKEFGGEKFQESIGVAKRALDAFGDEALKTALDVTGTGNHPAFLRFLWKVGQAVGEDGVKLSGVNTALPVSAAKKIFPNQN